MTAGLPVGSMSCGLLQPVVGERRSSLGAEPLGDRRRAGGACQRGGGRDRDRFGLGAHLTAPIDRPWTSLSCAAIPATSTGTEMTSEAADTWDRNSPWEVTKLVRNTGAVEAAVDVSTVAKRSSFQEKMKQISAVAARPGAVSGSRICANTRGSFAPSRWAASRPSTGTSARKERIIHPAIGMFIAE